MSNVVEFRNRYESDGRKRNYITGVGTRYVDATYGDITGSFLDAGGNFSGRARITRMVQYFDDEAEALSNDDEVMQIDITGFSRGAAQARDFANRVASATKNGLYKYKKTVNGVETTRCQKVNFRFLGLYDTVLSTDLGSGESYNLSIPDQFAYVAQAVALNEFRGSGFLFRPASSLGAFPLESICLASSVRLRWQAKPASSAASWARTATLAAALPMAIWPASRWTGWSRRPALQALR